MGGAALGAVIGLGLALISPPGYSADVTLLVAPVSKVTGVTAGDLQVAQGLTPTFAQLATTRPILDAAILATGSDVDAVELAKSVSTHVPVGTSLLTISVTGPNASDASAMANAIGAELQAYASPTIPGCPGPACADPPTGLTVELTVVDPAVPPPSRNGPGLAVTMAAGAAIALFLTVSVAFLVENVLPNRDQRDRASWASAASVAPAMADASVAGYDDTYRRTSATIGRDPLGAGPAAANARIATRGVINDLELEKNRRPE